ncbi:MAG: DNA alkylation repair protein, partial [Pseudomonadota bacterium]
MTPKAAIAALRAEGDPIKAAEMHKYHKVDRPYLGVANPVIDAHVKTWRAEVDLDTRLALAKGLWKGNTHEGRIAAAKLLT